MCNLDKIVFLSQRARGRFDLYSEWMPNFYEREAQRRRWIKGGRELLAKAEGLGLSIEQDFEWYNDWYWDDDDCWGKVDKCYYVGDLWINCVPVKTYNRGDNYTVNYGYSGGHKAIDGSDFYDELDGTGNEWVMAYWPNHPWSIEMVAKEMPHIPKHLRRECAEMMNTKETEAWIDRFTDDTSWYDLVDPEGEILEGIDTGTEIDAVWEFKYAILNYEASLMREAEEMFGEEWCDEIEKAELVAGQVGAA